jgi:CBS domain-containing protein
MREDVDVLRTTDTAADAARFLATHRDEAAPLCLSDGSLAGTVSSWDIVAQVVAKDRDPNQVSLSEFTGPADVVALDLSVPLEEAVALMCHYRRSRLFVLSDQRVVGFITQRDAARSVTFQSPWADS